MLKGLNQKPQLVKATTQKLMQQNKLTNNREIMLKHLIFQLALTNLQNKEISSSQKVDKSSISILEHISKKKIRHLIKSQRRQLQHNQQHKQDQLLNQFSWIQMIYQEILLLQHLCSQLKIKTHQIFSMTQVKLTSTITLLPHNNNNNNNNNNNQLQMIYLDLEHHNKQTITFCNQHKQAMIYLEEDSHNNKNNQLNSKKNKKNQSNLSI